MKIINCFITIVIPVFIFLYFSLYVWFSSKNRKWEDNVVVYLPPALFTLLIAYAVYIKASDFLNISALFQVSDRCLVQDIKINEESGAVYPIFINQGGDALAYEELVRDYNENNTELKERYGKQLLKIADNITSSDQYFQGPYFLVCRNRNKGSWEFNTLGKVDMCWGMGTEEWDEFDVPNVIEQVRHPTFWLTRAKAAKLLQNVKYLKSIKIINKANLKRLKDYGVEKMFENLIWNIRFHNSLIVRKISLDTYKLWACMDGVEKGEDGNLQKSCMKFNRYDIYEFTKFSNHWEKYKDGILKNFKRNIGLEE